MFSGVETKEGKKCSVVSCWNILKEEDKWKAKRIELLQLEKEASAGNKSKKNLRKCLDQEKRKEPTMHMTMRPPMMVVLLQRPEQGKEVKE
jgi:hypothetical protein